MTIIDDVATSLHSFLNHKLDLQKSLYQKIDLARKLPSNLDFFDILKNITEIKSADKLMMVSASNSGAKASRAVAQWISIGMTTAVIAKVAQIVINLRMKPEKDFSKT